MADIVITWPKSRSLQSYLDELDRAELEGLLINFRIPSKPREEIDRCYIVHDGAVRGWNEVIATAWIEDEMVRDPITDGYWPSGHYVTRHPHWTPIDPVPMKGFQGFRYWKEEDV